MNEEKPEEIEMEKRQMEIIKTQCYECSSNNTTCSETEMYCNDCGGYFKI